MYSGRELPIEFFGIPKNNEWGPVLWEMLHGAAEKLGQTSIKQLQDDQRREMILVLRYVETVMPCALCRNHYKEWRSKNPIDTFPTEIQAFKEAVRNWLFLLHQEINDSHELARVMTIGDLEDRYGRVDIKVKANEFYTLIERAVRLKAITSEAFKQFKTHFTYLVRLLM